jgi:hypothetical protein
MQANLAGGSVPHPSRHGVEIIILLTPAGMALGRAREAGTSLRAAPRSMRHPTKASNLLNQHAASNECRFLMIGAGDFAIFWSVPSSTGQLVEEHRCVHSRIGPPTWRCCRRLALRQRFRSPASACCAATAEQKNGAKEDHMPSDQIP